MPRLGLFKANLASKKYRIFMKGLLLDGGSPVEWSFPAEGVLRDKFDESGIVLDT